LYKNIIILIAILLFSINCNKTKDVDYYIEKGDYKQAEKILQKRIGDSDNVKDVKKLMILYTNYINDYQKSFEIAKNYIIKHKNLIGLEKISAISFYNYAINYLYPDTIKFDSIINLMDKAIFLDSIYAKPYLLKGKILVRQGFVDHGEDLIKKALLRDSTLLDGYLYLGNISMLDKKPKDAQDYYYKALSIDSTYYEAWINLGILYYKTENLKYALYAFKKAITYDSIGINAYDYIINIYHDAGMDDSAYYYANLFETKKDEGLKKNDNTDR